MAMLMPMALPRSLDGNTEVTMARPVTKIIPPAIPWKTLKRMSEWAEGETADSSDATVNRMTP